MCVCVCVCVFSVRHGKKWYPLLCVITFLYVCEELAGPDNETSVRVNYTGGRLSRTEYIKIVLDEIAGNLLLYLHASVIYGAVWENVQH